MHAIFSNFIKILEVFDKLRRQCLPPPPVPRHCAFVSFSLRTKFVRYFTRRTSQISLWSNIFFMRMKIQLKSHTVSSSFDEFQCEYQKILGTLNESVFEAAFQKWQKMYKETIMNPCLITINEHRLTGRETNHTKNIKKCARNKGLYNLLFGALLIN